MHLTFIRPLSTFSHRAIPCWAEIPTAQQSGPVWEKKAACGHPDRPQKPSNIALSTTESLAKDWTEPEQEKQEVDAVGPAWDV